MALCDYMLCYLCGAKVFYDAHVTYPDGAKVAALCVECAFDHDLIARQAGRDEEAEDAPGEFTVSAEEAFAGGPEQQPVIDLDLMEALKASLLKEAK